VDPYPRSSDWMPITPKTGPYSMPIHTLAPTEFGDALLPAQPFQYDADLLFS
jgi:hypothetical protein